MVTNEWPVHNSIILPSYWANRHTDTKLLFFNASQSIPMDLKRRANIKASPFP